MDTNNLLSNSPVKYVVAGVAAVVVAVGAYAIGHSNASSSTAQPALAAQPFAAQQGGGMPQQGGGVPQQGGGGFGTPATGAAAAKASTAATTKYAGQVERVMKLADGSYVVHVIAGSTEFHVLVSKDFKVTGAQQGGPGGAGGAPSGATGAPGTSQN